MACSMDATCMSMPACSRGAAEKPRADDRAGIGDPWPFTLPDEAATSTLAPRMAGWLKAGRSRHAVGRSRRRQDHLRARADPRPDRRPGARGAEPDLHADAGLRRAPRSRSSMPTSTGSSDSGELAELGWDEAAEGALVLVEWPERHRRPARPRPARHRASPSRATPTPSAATWSSPGMAASRRASASQGASRTC